MADSDLDPGAVDGPLLRGTESASRVADVLIHFMNGSDALGVSAIAADLELSKAVVHRILQSLVGRSLVVLDPHSRLYSLGPAAAALGARAFRDSELRSAALPVMRRLQQVTHETATVSAFVSEGRVYLDQVISNREIKMTVEVGRRFPLHAGSSSSCILAFLNKEAQETVLSRRLVGLTGNTVVDPAVIRERLESVRKNGFAQSDGERQEGAGSVAAPIFSIDGSVIGALSVCGPAQRVDARVRTELVPVVCQSADEVSRALGWAGGLPEPSADAN